MGKIIVKLDKGFASFGKSGVILKHGANPVTDNEFEKMNLIRAFKEKVAAKVFVVEEDKTETKNDNTEPEKEEIKDSNSVEVNTGFFKKGKKKKK